MTKQKMLSEKKIRGKTPDKVIEDIFELASWLQVFTDAGESVYGEDYETVLALVGLATAALVPSLNALVECGQKQADIIRKREESKVENNTDILKGFGIKLEGNDDIKS